MRSDDAAAADGRIQLAMWACRTADTHTSLGGAPGTRPPTHHQDHPRLPSHGLSILLLASATAVKTPLLLLLLLLRQQSPLLN